LNPNSLELLTDSKVEPALGDTPSGVAVQFERQGSFCLDARDASDTGAIPNRLVFNRTVGLRDSYAKAQTAAG
jgi:glutaminyl-tRNA synthetase